MFHFQILIFKLAAIYFYPVYDKRKPFCTDLVCVCAHVHTCICVFKNQSRNILIGTFSSFSFNIITVNCGLKSIILPFFSIWMA